MSRSYRIVSWAALGCPTKPGRLEYNGMRLKIRKRHINAAGNDPSAVFALRLAAPGRYFLGEQIQRKLKNRKSWRKGHKQGLKVRGKVVPGDLSFSSSYLDHLIRKGRGGGRRHRQQSSGGALLGQRNPCRLKLISSILARAHSHAQR
jgi:hypothetical protein